MTRRLALAFAAALLIAGTYAATLRATPQTGFLGTTLATASFDAFNITNKTIPADIWMEQLKTKGVTDVYVQQNTWQPGGDTGWHSHPGGSLIIVTSGTITAYEGDDQTCTPHVYTKGQGLVDAGGDHVHIIRNETTAPATSVTVQLIQGGQPRRIDEPAPGNCPF